MIRRALALGAAVLAAPLAAQEAGDIVDFEGQQYIVLGAGTDVMTTTASGESIVVVIEMTTPVAVIVPEPGTELRLDPSEPMLWLDGEPYHAFVSNAAYLRANAAGRSFALLEYDRAAN